MKTERQIIEKYQEVISAILVRGWKQGFEREISLSQKDLLELRAVCPEEQTDEEMWKDLAEMGSQLSQLGWIENQPGVYFGITMFSNIEFRWTDDFSDYAISFEINLEFLPFLNRLFPTDVLFPPKVFNVR